MVVVAGQLRQHTGSANPTEGRLCYRSKLRDRQRSADPLDGYLTSAKFTHRKREHGVRGERGRIERSQRGQVLPREIAHRLFERSFLHGCHTEVGDAEPQRKEFKTEASQRDTGSWGEE